MNNLYIIIVLLIMNGFKFVFKVFIINKKLWKNNVVVHLDEGDEAANS